MNKLKFNSQLSTRQIQESLREHTETMVLFRKNPPNIFVSSFQDDKFILMKTKKAGAFEKQSDSFEGKIFKADNGSVIEGEFFSRSIKPKILLGLILIVFWACFLFLPSLNGSINDPDTLLGLIMITAFLILLSFKSHFYLNKKQKEIISFINTYLINK